MRFGDPSKLQMGLRWVDDPDPPAQRPAEHGWSMGQLTIHVASVNVTATRFGDEQLPFVGWYLAPFLDWLATHWAVLLHEDRYPWPNASLVPAALACNRALDRWIAADDPQGRQHYADTQGWYFRHGIQSASAGGIFPGLYIRRVADDMELSWSGAPVEFTPDGLAFESGVGHARVPVRDAAEAMWQMLDWATSHPPESPPQYHHQIAALRTKVASLRGVEEAVLAPVQAAPAVFD